HSSGAAVEFLTSAQLGDGATGRGDLLLGGAGELVRADLDRDGDLSLAENLDQLVLADRAGSDELVLADLAALREQFGDRPDVHDLVFGAERVGEALELGQPHVDRHLPALEGGRDVLTSLGALGTTARGLTLGALTATHTGLIGLGAGGRTQVMQLDGHVRPPQLSRGGARR